MGGAWDILALRELEPSGQVAELALKGGAASNTKEQRFHAGVMLGSRSREQAWSWSQHALIPTDR